MSTRYELCADDGEVISSWTVTANWRCQTFTPAVAHTITSVKLLLQKIGSPTWNLIVEIRACDVNHKPTGAVLCSGSKVASSWAASPGSLVEVTLGAGAPLSASVEYAIQCRPDADDADNYLQWRGQYTTPTYAGGTFVSSQDGGSTWTVYNYDCNFEEWGVTASKSLGGTLNFSGSLAKKTLLKKIGTLNMSGAVATIYRQFESLAGTLNLTGALSYLARLSKSLSGTLNLSGTVSKVHRQFKSIAGVLNTTGSLISRRAAVILTGTLNLSGSLSSVKGIFKSLAGTLNMTGTVSRVLKIFKSLAGSLSFAGLVSVLRKIIGAGAVSVDSYLDINYFHLSKFTAEFTGIVSKLKIYSSTNTNVKVAVYSDVGGEPSSLLSVVNTSTAVVAGWNTITIPSVSVSIGITYWLAFNSG